MICDVTLFPCQRPCSLTSGLFSWRTDTPFWFICEGKETKSTDTVASDEPFIMMLMIYAYEFCRMMIARGKQNCMEKNLRFLIHKTLPELLKGWTRTSAVRTRSVSRSKQRKAHRSTGQEIPSLLRKTKVRYRVHKSRHWTLSEPHESSAQSSHHIF